LVKCVNCENFKAYAILKANTPIPAEVIPLVATIEDLEKENIPEFKDFTVIPVMTNKQKKEFKSVLEDPSIQKFFNFKDEADAFEYISDTIALKCIKGDKLTKNPKEERKCEFFKRREEE